MKTLIYFLLTFLINRISSEIELAQSHIVLSEIGYYFVPEQTVEWLNDIYVSSLMECMRQCNQNNLCRTFDYNFESNWCRLFELEPSIDEIYFDMMKISQFGYVQLIPNLFSSYNKTCNYCSSQRYLICRDDHCQCPWNTFWDESICQKERFAGSFCSENKQCRTFNYHLTCNSINLCTSSGYSTTNICSQNQSLILFNYTSPNIESYSFFTYNITANTTSMIITFSMFDLQGFWLLDKISLIDMKTKKQLLINEDFELGNLTGWNYCNPNSTNSSSQISQTIGNLTPKNGQYFYYGSSRHFPDYLSQKVSTTIENIYEISFWLAHNTSSTKNNFLLKINS